MIKLWWPENLNDGSTGKPTKHWNDYDEVLIPILKVLRKVYGNGSPSRVLFAKLRKGMAISEHADNGGALRDSHRTHTPIQTNEDVKFIVDGHRCEMNVGNIYEINNQLKHSVSNDGLDDRVHLIIDWHVQGEHCA